MFYYLIISRFIAALWPLFIIAAWVAFTWLVLWAGKNLARDIATESIGIYARINSARQDVRKREEEINAQAATFRVKMERDAAEARLLLRARRATLKAGPLATINQRFASGEFDIEIE